MERGLKPIVAGQQSVGSSPGLVTLVLLLLRTSDGT